MECFTETCANWPRFLVKKSSSDDLPLSRLLLFAMQKGFQAIARTHKSIKQLRDGFFLVEYARKLQAMGLLKTTQFFDRPMRVSVHIIEFVMWRHLLPWVIWHDRSRNQERTAGTGCCWGPQGDGEEGYWEGPDQHPASDLQHSRNAHGDYGQLSKSEGGLVSNWMRCCNCNKFGHTSQCFKVAAKCHWRSDPSCTLIAMVPMLHWLKIAQSGRKRRKFNVSALKNAYPETHSDIFPADFYRVWQTALYTNGFPTWLIFVLCGSRSCQFRSSASLALSVACTGLCCCL